MSLTKNRRVPGSWDMSIIRAGSPPTSGIEANSTALTRITPSVAAMGRGNGSLPVWANAGTATRSVASVTRISPIAI